jgi:hypothetical protein
VNVCPGCGQTFTRAANLAIHVNHFGTGPHQRPVRRGAAVVSDATAQTGTPQDATQERASIPAQQEHATSANEEVASLPTSIPDTM